MVVQINATLSIHNMLMRPAFISVGYNGNEKKRHKYVCDRETKDRFNPNATLLQRKIVAKSLCCSQLTHTHITALHQSQMYQQQIHIPLKISIKQV